MLGTINLPEYALGAFLIILLPGPNSLYVLSVAARRGVRVGYRAACGVFLGDSTLITLTTLGAASLLSHSPAAFDVVKYLGAAYLIVVALGMLRAAVKSARAKPADSGVAAATATDAASNTHAGTGTGTGIVTDSAKASSDSPTVATTAPTPVNANASQERPFRRALLVSLLNPKAILFFLAFFTQFVNPAYPHPAVPFIVLGLIVQTFSVAYLSTLILCGDRLAAAFRRRRHLSAWAGGAVGTVFLGFAAKLATATLH